LGVADRHVREQFSALADQVGASAEQVAGLAHALGVGRGEGEGVAPEQPGNLAGIDALVLGVNAVEGFAVPGLAQDESKLLLRAEIRDPGATQHTLQADDSVVAARSDGAQEGFGAGRQVAVEDNATGLVQDAAMHAPGVQVDAAVESVLSRVESHQGLPVRGTRRWLCRYFQRTR
jgi:hypothetical protein